jgi:drug/metabolite transporter (DMT)-like permease
MTNSTVKRSVTHWAALALVVNALMWGVSWWPFRQMQAYGLHPLWATVLVSLLALLCVLYFNPRVLRTVQQHPSLLLLALAAGCTNIGFTWAVTVGDVVRAVLLFYLMPAWVVLLAWPLLGERPRAGALVRMVLAMAGVSLVLQTAQTGWPWPQSLPDWLALGAGFCFALNNILLRRLHAAPPSANMMAMFAGGVIVGLLGAAGGSFYGAVPPLPALAWPWLTWVLALAAMLLLGNLCLQYGATRLRASTTSIIMLSEILFATVSALLGGAGTLTQRTLVGGAFIVLAAALSARSEQAH